MDHFWTIFVPILDKENIILFLMNFEPFFYQFSVRAGQFFNLIRIIFRKDLFLYQFWTENINIIFDELYTIFWSI